MNHPMIQGLKSPSLTLLAFLFFLPTAFAQNADNDEGWTREADHQNMMEQLGITALRPGANGRVAAGTPGAANYDEATANPYPDLPELLTLKDGRKVTTPAMWWNERRPEIIEDFEREIYGRVPENVPAVTWRVKAESDKGQVGGIPVIGKQLIGEVDNSAYPDIEVNIEMTLVLPAEAPGPVPVLMMFGSWGLGLPMTVEEEAEAAANSDRPQRPPPPNGAPPSTNQLIAAGWGYAYISPASIQADNGAGLTKGIIGLVNKGQPRSPEDWGSLRAWAWGAARGLDYLESEPAVDASKVGIEGVSRYGKAALVTLAFEPRFKMGLIGSSGKGGAALHRRVFGEAVENLTGAGEYHWMAGNYLKYGTEASSFGRMDAGDMPVDSHQLIALCAPRLTFISYGIPEQGDALWLDQQGSYMATVAAQPAFELLGASGIGETEDYRTAKMPPMQTGLMDGELAWRQHNGGHEDRSNMKFFLEWANRFIGHMPAK